MKTIRNLTHRPLRIQLAGGKVLHLGPARTGQIAATNLERPAIRRLIEAKQIEILDSGHGSHEPSAGGGEGHEATHARVPAKVPHPTGDR